MPGEVVSGIQASKSINFQKGAALLCVCIAGRLCIYRRTDVSVNASYCGMILLLRQLVSAGFCTKREAVRIANRLAVQTGVDMTISL